MERYICIHGHFYQPPRENAWLDAVERQDSAYPYHDWNDRINAECYAPNTASRILDDEGYITQIANNYTKISFNFGPTLLSWLQCSAPDTYQAIIDADVASRSNFSGHGSAMAQVYSHMIMPLANSHDKYTQIAWGIKDFEYRFGRRPEGMWLPETAVDMGTLDIMAELGIRFTILAPHQVKRVRKIGDADWIDLQADEIDFRMPYRVNLKCGRNINIFFYNGPISRRVAFDKILSDGRKLADNMMSQFVEGKQEAQLGHIANDGETYGHHHRFADMALAYAINYIESNQLAQMTNYGEYLEKFPPTHEVEIAENTSWSCSHGVERWRAACGCSAGGHKRFNQKWRKPLRQALDWLRDELAPRYEQSMQQLLRDPWAARDDYIEVVLDRSVQNVDRFIERHAVRSLNYEEKRRVLKLLELQRNAMLMYTSCGWYFDEIARIETVQIIQYAGRCIQLATELFDDNVEQPFLQLLEKAKSNYPQHQNGRRIYETYVKPSVIDLEQVAAHYAISSLFEKYGQKSKIYSYDLEIKDQQTFSSGNSKLILGYARISSDITWDFDLLSFGVLHFGEHNVNAGVQRFADAQSYERMLQEVSQTFNTSDFPEVIRLLDKYFGESTYSLKSLFWDEQRKALDWILESTLSQMETAYRQIYGHHFTPMRFISEMGTPVPKAFTTAAEYILNTDLKNELGREDPDIEHIRAILDEMEVWQVALDSEGISFMMQQTLEKMMHRLHSFPRDTNILDKVLQTMGIVQSMPFTVDLWRVQNAYWVIMRDSLPVVKNQAEQGKEKALIWMKQFHILGQYLKIRTV